MKLKFIALLLALSLTLTSAAFAPLAFAPAAFAQDETPDPPLTPTQTEWLRIIEKNDIEAARLKVKEPGFDPTLGLPKRYATIFGQVLGAKEPAIALLIMEAMPSDGYLSQPYMLDNVGKPENMAVLKALLAKKTFDPNTKLGSTPLIQTVTAAGNLEGVKMMLADPRVDPTIPGFLGQNALFSMAGTHSTELAKLLLADPRFDPTAPDADGGSALITAVISDDAEVTTVLMADPRVNVNARNGDGKTPLFVAGYATLDIALVLLRDPRVEVGADEVQQIGEMITNNQEDAANATKIAEMRKLIGARFANK